MPRTLRAPPAPPDPAAVPSAAPAAPAPATAPAPAARAAAPPRNVRGAAEPLRPERAEGGLATPPVTRSRSRGSVRLPGSRRTSRTSRPAPTGVGDQGPICSTSSPGVCGPPSSDSVCRATKSRSGGTPAAISDGAATPPITRGAASRPESGPGSGQRLVSNAYVSATSETVSPRVAWSGGMSSASTSAASVASPRTLTDPSASRNTDRGVSTPWCRPRARARSSAEAASPTMRRASSAGRPPSVRTDVTDRAPFSDSSTTNAVASSRPTSRTRTSRGSSTPAARRAASRAGEATGPSASKHSRTTSRSSVWSAATQRS